MAATINRKVTGLYSLDRAFINHLGEIGVPVGAGIEIFGATGIGKSTFAYSLAGLLTDMPIVLSDFEGYDERWVKRTLQMVGHSGEIVPIEDKEDEEQLDAMLSALKEKYDTAIFDSISAVSPIAETAGDLGDANMGRRAFIMAQFTRKALHLYRFSPAPKTIIAINHWRAKIGSMGYEAPGGSIKNYLFTVQILLKRKDEFPDGSYILEGKVTKNRWGYTDKTFNIFVVGGMGVHKGLTLVWDAVMNDVLSYKNGVIRSEDKSWGRLSGLVKSAKQGDPVIPDLAEFNKLMEVANGTKDTKDNLDGTEKSEGNELSDPVAD